jgi:phosphatidylglycerol:prolipoprotein diacylglycerol transferase|tara:strand:- start:452 stop:1339 length:888 start_codon:yes stop_codon:yes gene_type:complete
MIPFPENIKPEVFSVSLGDFTFTLYWYALAYILGIIACWRLAAIALKKNELWQKNTPPLNPVKLEDLMSFSVLGIIFGGRLGFVIFYNPEYYLQNPLEVLFIWQGGMSFHGGLIGVATASFLFFRKNSVPLRSGADLLALGTPIGLGLGRLANFINDELWGRVTDVPWGVIVNSPQSRTVCQEIVDHCIRHPSQIYEAILEGLILFILMMYLAFKRNAFKRPGFLASIFFMGYGLSRCFVELFRQPDQQFQSVNNPMGFFIQFGEMGLTMGQVLSLPMIVIGIILFVTSTRNKLV